MNFSPPPLFIDSTVQLAVHDNIQILMQFLL